MNNGAALIVEDDDSVMRLLEIVLRKHYASVDVASDGQSAIEMVGKRAYELVMLDLMLPKANGFLVSQAIQALPKQPKMIVLSAIARYFEDRFPEGTVLLQKPFDVDRIEWALRTAAP